MEYKCNDCNKEYKTYQTLWIHNKKFHTINNEKLTESQHTGQHKVNINALKCSKCMKVFKHKQSKSRHMKTCNVNEDLAKKVEKLEAEIKTLKNNSKSSTKNITNNNNGTIINNNIYINPPGKENLNRLSSKDVKEIFNENLNCVIKYIEKRNFNDNLIENHSFCVTNRDGKHLLTYDTDSNNVESQKKKYFLDKIITQAIKEVETLYNKHKTTFSKKNQNRIEDNINSLKDYNDKGTESKIYRELLEELNLQMYNKRSIIIKTWIKILGADTFKKFKISTLDIDKGTIELEDIFIMPNDFSEDSESDAESDSDSVKQLIPKKKQKEPSSESGF
jgi:hypothetical protein